jgi:spore coat polysaccharide biosynthesis protein SpsF
MNVIALVQARLGSARLPGKVLLDIHGHPVLWHIVRRLRAAKMVDRVVIACPGDAPNRPIVEMAAGYGIDCFAGNEDDLVDRIYQAAREYAADAVVWVTADCPLVDPSVVDTVVKLYADNLGHCDVASTGKPREVRPLPWGLGTAVIDFKVLERLWRELKDPFWREWFVAYIADHPKEYNYLTIPLDRDMTHRRWMLDYPEDLDFVRTVYRRLDREDDIFTYQDVLKLVAEHPELDEKN